MPRLSEYARLAPFTLDELVEAANSLLRGTPGAEVTQRTVRYYIAESRLPGPIGPPKTAKYTVEALARLVGLRLQQRRGLSLDRVSGEFDSLDKDAIAGHVQALLDGDEPVPAQTIAMHAPVAFDARTPFLSRVTRLRLTPNTTLEIDAGVDPATELSAIQSALKNMRQDLLDSS